jgi:hypothetical protein
MKPKSKVVVVLPTYQADKTLEKTIRDTPLSVVDETISITLMIIFFWGQSETISNNRA